MKAIDLAPTLAFLMNMPGPQNARGRSCTACLSRPDKYKEITILDISDYHGQLIPLSDTADNLTGTGAANPSFAIGGAAFLKPGSTLTAPRPTDGSFTVAAGDSDGRDPAHLQLLRRYAHHADDEHDGLRRRRRWATTTSTEGQAYLRNTLIPLANFPFLSSNILDAHGRTPAEWSPSQVFHFHGGGKLGMVGFSNEDIPDLDLPRRAWAVPPHQRSRPR